MTDPRFHAVRAALAAYASDPDDPPPTHGEVVQAAVAVILREEPDDLELLLIKRARNPRDPWSGHMALPGGRHDPDDASLMHTAVREAREETGVVLDLAERALGTLSRVAPQGPVRPRIQISPYVFAVPEGTTATGDPLEVARVHWTPLALLRDPTVRDQVEIDLPGGMRRFPCFRVHGEVVWGLTYRILRDFLSRMESPSPPPIPR